MAFTRMQRAMCKEPFATNYLQRTVNKRPFAEDYLQATNTRYTNQSKRPVTKTSHKNQSQKQGHKTDRKRSLMASQKTDYLKYPMNGLLKGSIIHSPWFSLQSIPFNTCLLIRVLQNLSFRTGPSEPVLQNPSFKTCSSKHAFHLTPVPRQQKTDLVFHLGWRS